MAIISLPYSFSAGQTAYSAQVDLNFSTVYAAVNGQLDSSNISSTRGIGANYIVSSGSGATGVFTPGQYSITAPSTGIVPFTLTGLTGQTAALQLWNSSTTTVALIDPAGNLTANSVNAPTVNSNSGTLNLQVNGTQIAQLNSTSLSTPSGIGFQVNGSTVNSAIQFGVTPTIFPGVNNDGAGGGMNIVYPSATSTNGVRVLSWASGPGYTSQFQVGNGATVMNNAVTIGTVAANLASLSIGAGSTPGGTLYVGQSGTSSQVVINGGTGFGTISLGNTATPSATGNYIVRGTRDTYPYLAGIYNNNVHIYTGVATVTVSGGYGYATVTIPAAYAFTSNNSFVVLATYQYSAALALNISVWAQGTSATTFNVGMYRADNISGSQTIQFMCIGY